MVELALPLPPPVTPLLAGRGETAPSIVSSADFERILEAKPASKELPWWKKYASEIIWGLWFLTGIGWELFTVFTEKRTSQEPLTRLLRDRLMRRGGYVGRITTLSFIVFIAWLVPHFLLP